MQNLLSKIIEIRKLTVWSEWRCIDNLGYFNNLKNISKLWSYKKTKTTANSKKQKTVNSKSKKTANSEISDGWATTKCNILSTHILQQSLEINNNKTFLPK
jgi:hypothetical protein